MKLITEEVARVKFIVEGKGAQKKMYIEGTFLQGEIKNRNGRMYPINGVQSGTVTLNYGDANLSATDAVGEIRRLVKVAVRGTGKTHISEVQIVGDF